VSWNEVKIVTIQRLFKVQWLFLSVIVLFFVKHLVELVEILLDHFGVLVANVTKLARGLCHEVVIEVHLVTECNLDVICKLLHSPGLVKLADVIVIIDSGLVSTCLQCLIELVKSGGD